MKKAFLSIGLIVLFLALSGCVQEPEAGFKYVCPDNTVVDSPALCQTIECMDCDQYCEDKDDSIGASGEMTVDKILTAVNTANYCETKEDCVLIDTKCPIGCYNLVNAGTLDSINVMVKEFKQTCFQTCTALKEIQCQEGKCVPILPGND